MLYSLGPLPKLSSNKKFNKKLRQNHYSIVPPPLIIEVKILDQHTTQKSQGVTSTIHQGCIADGLSDRRLFYQSSAFFNSKLFKLWGSTICFSIKDFVSNRTSTPTWERSKRYSSFGSLWVANSFIISSLRQHRGFTTFITVLSGTDFPAVWPPRRLTFCRRRFRGLRYATAVLRAPGGEWSRLTWPTTPELVYPTPQSEPSKQAKLNS